MCNKRKQDDTPRIHLHAQTAGIHMKFMNEKCQSEIKSLQYTVKSFHSAYKQ